MDLNIMNGAHLAACNDCGAVYLKEVLQEVEEIHSREEARRRNLRVGGTTRHYCPAHRKPYERVTSTSGRIRYYRVCDDHSTEEVDSLGWRIS